jgi:hypothetical protein
MRKTSSPLSNMAASGEKLQLAKNKKIKVKKNIK